MGAIDTLDPTKRDGRMAPPDYSADLGPENALPGQRYFDKSVDTDLVNPQAHRDIEGLLSYGLDKAPDIGGGMGHAPTDDPMVKALGKRYETETNANIGALKNTIHANAPVAQSNQETTASHELGAEYATSVANFQQQYQYQVQRQNLFNQYQTALAQGQAGLIGSVLGGIGALGGALIGGAVGGPGGAAAGAVVGGKL